MRVLLAHRFVPGQFVHLASALVADPAHEVVFLFEREHGEAPIAGLRTRSLAAVPAPHPATHPHLLRLDGQLRRGAAAYEACLALRDEGFHPDVMLAHAGSGLGLYLRDAFPCASLVGYFEWYFRGRGPEARFLDGESIPGEDLLRSHICNACVLMELVQCDRGVCPTRFQREQFPPEFREKLEVIHDGVDPALFERPDATSVHDGLAQVVPPDAEVVTYAARGLEPVRGFPQFLQVVALLQGARPRLHAVVAGSDESFYSRPLPFGRTFRDDALERIPSLDRSRLHFLGFLPREEYRRLLFSSAVHVHLTVPFVLSWSLVEAMAAGCAIVASDTEPVREVLRDGVDAVLVDFHSPVDTARAVARLLDDRATAGRLAAAARRVAEEHFSVHRLVPRLLAFLRDAAAQKDAPPAPPRPAP